LLYLSEYKKIFLKIKKILWKNFNCGLEQQFICEYLNDSTCAASKLCSPHHAVWPSDFSEALRGGVGAMRPSDVPIIEIFESKSNAIFAGIAGLAAWPPSGRTGNSASIQDNAPARRYDEHY